MTLRVWIFCLLSSVGFLVGNLLVVPLEDAAVRALCFFAGSAISAFYFTRPGFMKDMAE